MLLVAWAKYELYRGAIVPTGYDLNWTAVVVAAGVGFMAMALMFVLSFILSPRRHLDRKGIAYECGIEPESYTPVHLNIRYYIFAILFLIFDVEAVFLFPWAVVYQDLGLLAFIEAFLFVLILVVGFAYVWAKGDLDWVKMNVKYGKGRYSNLRSEGESI